MRGTAAAAAHPALSFAARGDPGRALDAAAEWVALADRADAAPFVRPEWVLPWWTAFGRGRLDLVEVWQGDHLRAAMPVVRRGRALASPTNWHTPLFGAVAESSRWMDRLTDMVFAGAPRRCVLDLVPASGPTHLAFVGAAERLGYWVATGLRQRSPFISLDGGWEVYQAGLGRNLRRNVRRYRRRLERLGELRLDVDCGPGDPEPVLDEGLGLEASGWKGRVKTAIDTVPEARRFYHDVARFARQRGWLQLATLRLEGRVIAFDLCIEHAGVHYVLKTAYDEGLANLSPGLILRNDMIQRAFARGLTRYELLGGDEPWKREWTGMLHERVRVRALAPGPATAPERFLRESDAPPVRWLRDRLAPSERHRAG